MKTVLQYANCWEDADVLLKAFGQTTGRSFVSIASAGDNSLSLLTLNPRIVLGIDKDPAQIACARLKQTLFEIFDYGEILAFLGVHAASNRIQLYRRIRSALPPDTRQFWDAHTDTIDRGLIHAGKLERYFSLFRRFVLPVVAGNRKLRVLLEARNIDQRRSHFENRLQSRWKEAVLRRFFDQTVLSRLGRSPAKFSYVQINVAEHILERIRHGLVSIPTHENPYLQYILFGNYKTILPHYLQKENFESIKRNIHHLSFIHGDIAAVLQRNLPLRFDGFNLSDIFEYVDDTTHKSTMNCIADSAKKGAVVLYWNMLVPRHYKDGCKFRSLDILAKALYEQSKTFFYKDLIIEERIENGSS